MGVQAMGLAVAILAEVAPDPCAQKGFRESPNHQCIQTLGEGESRLRTAERLEKAGDPGGAKAAVLEAYHLLRVGLLLSRRPEVTAFPAPVIRLYYLRLADASRRIGKALEAEGAGPEARPQRIKALDAAAEAELRARLQCSGAGAE